ncbi:MAG: PAS domain S-box protein [Vulcanimicrobiota bacterium]
MHPSVGDPAILARLIEAVAELEKATSEVELVDHLASNLGSVPSVTFCQVRLGGARAVSGQVGAGALHRRQISSLEIEFQVGDAGYETFLESFFKLLAVALQHWRGEQGGHWYWLETMDRVHRAIQSAQSLEELLENVLGCMLSIFDSDRAYLLFPADPHSDYWEVPMECTRPEFPGAGGGGQRFPMDVGTSQAIAFLLAADGPLKFGPGGHPVPPELTEAFATKAGLAMAIYPKVGRPWLVAMHQCSFARSWTDQESRLFQEIARRLSDALTGWTTYREMQASERRFRRITEGTSDFLYSLQVKSGSRSYSPGCLRVTGYTPEVLASCWLELVLPEDQSQPLALERLALSGQDPSPIEYRILRQDGQVRWLSESAVLLRDQAGDLLSVEGVVKDITAFKLAEERLRKLSRAVEQCPASISIMDLSGRIEYVNPKFTQLTGYSSDSLIGTELSRLSVEPPPGEVRMLVKQALERGHDWHGEVHTRRQDGQLQWELVTLSAILDQHGQATHLLAVSEDITERKRLEAEIRQAQKMEAFGQLAGGIAHDFNNILTVIQGNASLLNLDLSEDEKSKAVDEISLSSERAARLTRQLLTFSRRQKAERKRLDLNQVLEPLNQMLQRLIGEHIEFTADYAAPGAPVLADPGMMEQLVMNLVINARDAMAGGGCLTISTRVVHLEESECDPAQGARPGEFVRLQVSDSGCGIASQDVSKIFEPFYTTKEVGKGTGLGLATVFGIVQQHQGWVTVSSQLGRGSCFSVFLPVQKARIEPEQSTVATLPEQGGQETILLVEDEPALRRLLVSILRPHGYQVLAAESGVAALQLWNSHKDRIQLLLTDVVMPGGLSGLELGRRLQAEKLDLRVLYSTGYTDELLGEASRLRGSDGFLEKPYDRRKLLAKVRACLDAPAESSEPHPSSSKRSPTEMLRPS